MTTVTPIALPSLNLSSIEQTLEQFGFVVNFITPIFPAAPLVLAATETILKAGAAIQAAPNTSAPTLAAALVPHVQSFAAALEALIPPPPATTPSA